MIKVEDLAKYNFADLTPSEDGTIALDAVIEAARKQTRELALQDKDFIDPIKVASKMEGSAIERKRALKSMRAKFGLELTNTQMDEMDIDAVLDLIHSSSTAKTSTDIKELQDKIIEANKKAQAAEEALSTKAAEIEKQFAKKIAAKEVDKQVLRKRENEKMMISAERTLSMFQLELKENGYHAHLTDDNKVKYTTDEAGQYAVLRKDGTGLADTDYLFDLFFDEFKHKNNGSGAAGGGGTPSGGGQPSKPMSDHMKRLQASFNRPSR
jgi:hypothetical protein